MWKFANNIPHLSSCLHTWLPRRCCESTPAPARTVTMATANNMATHFSLYHKPLDPSTSHQSTDNLHSLNYLLQNNAKEFLNASHHNLFIAQLFQHFRWHLSYLGQCGSQWSSTHPLMALQPMFDLILCCNKFRQLVFKY